MVYLELFSSPQLLSAHSLMLSVCSPYFRRLLSENRHKEKHHIIHLHGVSPRHMQQLLLYMYRCQYDDDDDVMSRLHGDMMIKIIDMMVIKMMRNVT